MIWLILTVACISRTVTQEEVFRELRDYCRERSSLLKAPKMPWWKRKCFYLVTCEYCFSHWVTAMVMLATAPRLVFEDWRGIVLAFFSIVWLANVVLALFEFLKVLIKHRRALTDRYYRGAR